MYIDFFQNGSLCGLFVDLHNNALLFRRFREIFLIDYVNALL